MKQKLVLSNELIKVKRFGKLTFRALTLRSPARIEELRGLVGLYEEVEELCLWWKQGDINFSIN